MLHLHSLHIFDTPDLASHTVASRSSAFLKMWIPLTILPFRLRGPALENRTTSTKELTPRSCRSASYSFARLHIDSCVQSGALSPHLSRIAATLSSKSVRCDRDLQAYQSTAPPAIGSGRSTYYTSDKPCARSTRSRPDHLLDSLSPLFPIQSTLVTYTLIFHQLYYKIREI